MSIPGKDFEDIREKPSANGKQVVGQDGVCCLARAAPVALDAYDFSGEVGCFSKIMAMAMTIGVVAGRAGDYLLPRMCGYYF